MVDNDTKEMLSNALFTDEPFAGIWMEIKQEYDVLGFQDPMSDEQRIEEYTYIAQQLNKYKGSVRDQIMNHDSYEDMKNEVANLVSKTPEYAHERSKVVYNFMRDQWLINMYNMLARIAEANYEDDYEEDEDA